MSYLLDTCTVCEPTRKHPNPNVVEWLDSQQEWDLYLSVLSLGEIAKGIAMLEESKRKHRLEAWLHTDLPERFEGRILDLSSEICVRWGEITGTKASEGIQIPVVDGLLAATALGNSLVVVTRNVDDFVAAEVPVLNPWEDVPLD